MRKIESVRPHRWIQLHGFLEVWNRSRRIAVARQQLPQIVQRIAIVRINADGFLIVFQR
jgi:hypothetical protein